MKKTGLRTLYLIAVIVFMGLLSSKSHAVYLIDVFHNTTGVGVDIRALCVNDGGIATGRQLNGASRRAFVYENGTVTELPILPTGTKSEGNGINDLNQAVGYGNTSSGWHVTRWDRVSAGVWTANDLGLLSGGSSNAFAMAINDLGEIAGSDSTAAGPAILYLPFSAYSLPAGINSLGTLGGTHAEGWGINENGEVVGFSKDAGGTDRAFIWLPTAKYGQPAGISQLALIHPAYAVDINDSGQVATYRLNGGVFESVLWESGVKTLLPKLAGATHMNARAINNSGVIVGSIDMPAGRVGFVWDSVNGTQLVSEMETAGWTSYEFHGISDTGYICGYGTDPSSQKASFVLSNVQTCGDGGFHAGDLTKDCYVNFLDFGEFVKDWLKCTDPSDSNCVPAL